MKDYTQMEIDVTLESDRDLKENMQAAAKFALGQIIPICILMKSLPIH